MNKPFITPKAPPPALSQQERDLKRLAEVREAIAKRRAELEWEALKQTLSHNVVNPIGPKYDGHAPKERKQVEAFDPFAPREVDPDRVNWEAQQKAKDMSSQGGRKKKGDGSKNRGKN